jgi:hypothetical protein
MHLCPDHAKEIWVIEGGHSKPELCGKFCSCKVTTEEYPCIAEHCCNIANHHIVQRVSLWFGVKDGG